VTLDMVAIPSGTFMMGSPENEKGRYDDESPQHQVKVPAFYMARYPITVTQWKAIRYLPKVNKDLNYIVSDSNFPVTLVSWDDAIEFCARLSNHTGKKYRLPSEAEWEYACRAGTTTPFHFGETITTDLANYNGYYTYASESRGKDRGYNRPVGSFPPNAFGLHNMHGNVWEWCEDDWHQNYQNAPTDGSAWLSGASRNKRKVMRGGSWDDSPADCRSASRNYDDRSDRDHFSNVGFRVVCVPPSTT